MELYLLISLQVYQMWSGFPRHVPASAYDSRQVLTFHVIYQVAYVCLFYPFYRFYNSTNELVGANAARDVDVVSPGDRAPPETEFPQRPSATTYPPQKPIWADY